MILGFSTTFPDGTPTNFEQKILSGEKIHTLREGDRWEAGRTIQMATGVRTKDYHQFNKNCPYLNICLSTQEAHMTFFRSQLEITIDEKYRYCTEIEALIKNDGLTKDQFINWFFPKGADVWSGQIIHWTLYKY